MVAETDVVIVGLGGAGACAALEAREAGAEVIALERAWKGGRYGHGHGLNLTLVVRHQ